MKGRVRRMSLQKIQKGGGGKNQRDAVLPKEDIIFKNKEWLTM